MKVSLNLRQRFSLIVLLSIAIASGVMIATIYWAVSKYTREYTLHYWQETTQTFANNAKFSVMLASISQATDIASHFNKDDAIVKARLYLPSEQVLASVGENVQCKENTEEFRGDKLKPNLIVMQEIENHWCFLAPIHYQVESELLEEPENSVERTPQLIGYAELVVSKQRLKALINQVLAISIFTVILFELVIFFTVRHFSDVFTRGFLELSRVMTQTAQGQRDVRAIFTGPAEILVIKDQLNQMLDQLQIQNEQLEAQVVARTQELKMALDSALSASEYKSKIISTVSHEMKSPLHGFMGYSQLALEQLNESDQLEITEFLQKGMECARNLENQINQILDYARLESGKTEIHKSRFELKSLITRCVEKIQPLTEQTGNLIKTKGETINIEMDEDKLMHILLNLIDNANKFTQEGRIDINWSDNEGNLLIKVSDTGCGIKAEDQENIFQPFWQADMSFSRPAGGTGLGLAICDSMTQLLGGRISVTSDENGSTFTLNLPIATD